MAYIPPSGSVVAFQSDPTKLVGTSSVIQGTSPWVVQLTSGSIATSGGTTGNSSVQLVPGQAAIGSVTTLQGTNPWVMIGSISGGVSSVSQVGNWNIQPASVQLMAGTNNQGSVTAIQGTNPWLIGNSSVQAVAGTATIGSVATLQGTTPWTVGPSSVMLIGSTNTSISALITNQLTGVCSVMLFGSTNASVTALVSNLLTGNSSVQLISTSASIIAQNKAIFGANNTWTQTNSVQAIGAVRNDTLASITAADSTYSPFAVGSSGETIVANAPITKWVSGVTSVMYGPSVVVLAAQGASIFTYITGLHLINEASVTSRVTFTQGAISVASTLLYAIAPAGGGTNMQFANPIKTLDNRSIGASISGISSVYVTMTGFISKT